MSRSSYYKWLVGVPSERALYNNHLYNQMPSDKIKKIYTLYKGRYGSPRAESFFKTLKMELIYQNRYETGKQAELSIFEYIEGFYNTHRRHKYLENKTVSEFNQLLLLTNLKSQHRG